MISLYGQDMSFYKENITMKIENGAFFVSGTYFIKSDISTKGTLLYPFPVDSIYGKVDSVYIINLTTNKVIKPLKTEPGYIILKIDFDNYKNIELQIGYKQELKANQAEYILKTTIDWKKPLLHATYQLIVPINLHVTSFSIQPHDSITTPKEKVYYWSESDYMPQENMIFKFHNIE